MFKLYRPLKTSLLTQGFGRQNTKPNLIPLYEGYGLRGHNGLDFLAQDKEPIYFNYSGKGKVIEAKKDSAGGLGVTVISDDKDGAWQYRFWHLKSFAVKKDDVVETGDLLGYADNTGISTATHLHFDLKPLTKIANGAYKNTFQDNGYYGAVSPTRYWDNIFVVDKMQTLTKKLLGLWITLLSLLKKCS